MKFESLGEQFIHAVEQVAKARSKSNQTAHLQDVYLELEDHILTLRATNLEIICEKSIAVKGIHNGSCIVKGDILVKAASVLKNKTKALVCELVEGVFVITSGKDVLEIKTTQEEDFPTLPHTGEELFTISQDQFSKNIREVLFCVATTEIKPEIASVYFYTTDTECITVGTDSYRLAEKRTPFTQQKSVQILIPGKILPEVMSILENEDGDIMISKHEGTLTFSKETLTLSIQTTQGQFPDYRQLFPKEYNTTVSVLKEDLSKALSTTSLFTENFTPLLCQIDQGKFILQTKNENLGSATQTIDIQQEGQDIQANYNNRYFLDVLPHITGKTLTLQFTTPNRPVVIQGSEDQTFTYLLMPINR
jgi:DNA polymerase-3 subunit beta